MPMMYVPDQLEQVFDMLEEFTGEELQAAARLIRKQRLQQNVACVPDALKCCGWDQERIDAVMERIHADISKL